MNNTREEVLTARVQAVNAAHKKANELYNTLSDIFKPLVGQTVYKADGELLAKVEKLLPSISMSGDDNVSVYRHKSAYSLAWTVKACQGIGNTAGPHTCLYHETTVYIAQLSDGKITYIQDPHPRRDDYTTAEIAALRATAAQAKKDYEAAKSKLDPFGESDPA